MAENPLLPHRRLQELHALMLRCRELERQRRFAPALAREAILAATAIQAEAGDVVCGEPGDLTVDQVLAKCKPSRTMSSAGEASPQKSAPAKSHLLVCAGIARGLQTAGKGACFAFVSSGSKDTSWSEALSYAQAARLPLIVICADSTASASKPSNLSSLEAVSKLCKGLRLPVLSVDGEDAVAVYRVVQESIIRVRHADGPTMVWCSLKRQSNTAGKPSRPVAHMEQYLAARGLKPLKRT